MPPTFFMEQPPEHLITFQPSTILKIFEENYNSKDTEITDKALHAVCEYLRLFSRECIWRAHDCALKECEEENINYDGVIREDHLQKIATGALLDF